MAEPNPDEIRDEMVEMVNDEEGEAMYVGGRLGDGGFTSVTLTGGYESAGRALDLLERAEGAFMCVVRDASEGSFTTSQFYDADGGRKQEGFIQMFLDAHDDVIEREDDIDGADDLSLGPEDHPPYDHAVFSAHQHIHDMLTPEGVIGIGPDGVIVGSGSVGQETVEALMKELLGL